MAEAASLDREAVGVAVRATARPYAPGWLHILLRRLDELPGPALAAYVVIGAAQSLVFHLIPWSKGTAPVGQLDTINLYQDETERRLKGLLAELGRDVDARDLARADGLNKTLDSLLRQRRSSASSPRGRGPPAPCGRSSPRSCCRSSCSSSSCCSPESSDLRAVRHFLHVASPATLRSGGSAMLKRLFVIGATAASVGAAIGYIKARAAFRTWGVVPEEATKPMPGDDLVAEAEAIDTRGIDIAAPPEEVWPWLVQMGYGRAGWYSYDELDMDRPSAERIVPELQHVAVGDVFPTHPGGGFVVKVVEPHEALVLYADRELVEAQAKAAKEAGESIETATPNVRATGAYLDATMRGDFKASWAFVLEPIGEGRTRLIERFRGKMEMPVEPETPKFAPELAGKAMLFGLFVMVRKQLLGIRDRAEGRAITHAPWREAALRAREKAMAAAAQAREAAMKARTVGEDRTAEAHGATEDLVAEAPVEATPLASPA